MSLQVVSPLTQQPIASEIKLDLTGKLPTIIYRLTRNLLYLLPLPTTSFRIQFFTFRPQ